MPCDGATAERQARRPIAQGDASDYLKQMSKPLLYAFGGLPVALLGVLIGLSYEKPRQDAAIHSEELKPVMQPQVKIESAPPMPQPELPPPRLENAAPTPEPVVPPMKQEAPKAQVDGSEEAGPSPRTSPPPAIEKPETAEIERTLETAAIDARPTAATGEPPIFGGATGEIAAQDPGAKPAGKTGRVIVQRGNTLWRLSRVIYGRGREYVKIAAANRDIIKDPSLIYPGQVIVIPGAEPPALIDARRKRPLRPDEGGLSFAE